MMINLKSIAVVCMLCATTTIQAQVGVGTTTPDASAALEVQSTTSGVLIPRMSTTERDAIASPATGLMVFNNTTSSFQFYDGTAWSEVAPSAIDSTWTKDATNSLISLTNTSDGTTARSGNNVFVITDAGRVGIGTDSPSGHFEVSSTAGTNVDIVAGGNGRPQMRFFNGGGYGWNFGVVNPGTAVMSDGFVIRDVKKGQDRLRISSSGYYGFSTNPNTTGDLVKVNGSIGATAFNTTSDARLKSNVTPISGASNIINQLRPVSYSKINSSDKTGTKSNFEYGFIAQEVREILPTVVSGNETDSTYLSLNYNSFVSILAAATQEQDARITALEEALNEQIALNESLTRKGTGAPTHYAYIGGALAFVSLAGAGWFVRDHKKQNNS